ncbi:MAG: c-type cytochrome [Candidatus Binatia bacterium]
MLQHILVIGFSVFFGLTHAEAAGDAEQGQRTFRQCAACHSLEPGRHLTGPSLAQIWKRKAGTIEGFPRYSEALKKSGIVWDERALDRWLKESQAMVPGNLMTFPAIQEGRVRADLIAYLKEVSSGRRVAETPRRGGMMGGSMLNLKELGKDHRVRAIRHCGDTYYVTNELGKTLPYWEFNLRFKTDSSPDGPPKGTPVLIRASMRGDRAFVIFSSPEEISTMIKRKC